MLQAATSTVGQLLRAWQVLTTVGKGFGFLLKQAEFLQVVRAKANQVALAGDGNLQRLANPPRCIRCQPRAVAHVEAVDGLHEAANGFLQQVRVAQAVVPESFRYVGGEADVC